MTDTEPLTHIREFRVRHYECDAFGHLNNTNYLRYMQETAFDASAAAGYDRQKYDQLGCYWLIRETDIKYLKPAQYGDTLAVKTWVVDFRRVRSRRVYEFTLTTTGEIIAKAVTDWVYLESDSGSPVRIPTEIINAFFPKGAPDNRPPRQKFPLAPPPPAGKFEMQLLVKWQDLDPIQHVNNAVYLDYINECGMQVIAAYNWPIKRMLEEGHAFWILRHQIQYKQQALMGDDLEITTWLSNARSSTATRHYQIKRKSDGAVIANIHSLGVWIDLTSGRPQHFPENLLEDFAPNLVG
jgi:acyl-CoA thioester hydrolase